MASKSYLFSKKNQSSRVLVLVPSRLMITSRGSARRSRLRKEDLPFPRQRLARAELLEAPPRATAPAATAGAQPQAAARALLLAGGAPSGCHRGEVVSRVEALPRSSAGRRERMLQHRPTPLLLLLLVLLLQLLLLTERYA